MEKKEYKWPINILENKPSLTNNLGNAHYNVTLFSIKLLLSVKRRSTKQYECSVDGESVEKWHCRK